VSTLPSGDTPVVLNAQAQAEQTAQSTRNRVRDQQRASNAPDNDELGRATQGEGRQQN
jgi:hypothetical protein